MKKNKLEEEIEFSYLAQPPKKWTFEQPKLRKWIEEHCQGKVLNLFAGKTKLNVNEFRVDSSDEFKPDWLGNAMDFIKTTEMKFDTIILDPPYSLRKSYEKYQGHYIGSKWTQVKRELKRVCNLKCKVISLGYNSQGMSKINGFKKVAILLICHNGDHNDTIVTMEEMI